MPLISNLSPARLRKKLKAAGLDQNMARSNRPELPRPQMDLDYYERYVTFRQLFEYLALLAVTPIRVPARRRRSDREVPKAA